MSSQHRIVIVVVVFSILLGAFILINDTSQNTITILQAVLVNGYSIPRGSEILKLLSAVSEEGISFLKANKEMLFYGGVALFGAMMMGLVASSIVRISRQQNKIQSVLKSLLQEKERAEKLSQLRSEFLNCVSHELRIPLTMIVGYVDCLADGLYGRIHTEHKEILEVVSRQSGELKKMIDQILICSRLEEDKRPLRVEEFPINRILGELKDTYDFLARQKGIEMSWDLPAAETILRSDPERLRDILSNLLQNAMKYTDHGSVRCHIQHLPDTDSIELEVADTGVGIPRDSLATIFDPFVQVYRRASQGSRGGFGLGLSIVKKNVEQLKGKITVDSKLGQGSTFRIIFPRLHIEKRDESEKLSPLTRIFRARNATAEKIHSGKHPVL